MFRRAGQPVVIRVALSPSPTRTAALRKHGCGGPIHRGRARSPGQGSSQDRRSSRARGTASATPQQVAVCVRSADVRERQGCEMRSSRWVGRRRRDRSATPAPAADSTPSTCRGRALSVRGCSRAPVRAQSTLRNTTIRESNTDSAGATASPVAAECRTQPSGNALDGAPAGTASPGGPTGRDRERANACAPTPTGTRLGAAGAIIDVCLHQRGGVANPDDSPAQRIKAATHCRRRILAPHQMHRGVMWDSHREVPALPQSPLREQMQQAL